MKIYRGIEELIEVDPQGSSAYVEQVMGEHKITLVFELSECFELRIGDYVVESGINYRLNRLPTIKKLSKKLFQYNAVFEPPKYDLLKRIFLLFDNTGAAIQGEFSMTGNALDFMTLLVANMNRGSSGWLVGDVLDTEYVTLTFSNETCMAVLERLASEFDTEYHVVNKTLHLQNKSTARELTLEYGESAYDIERLSVNTADVVTRLYAFGSDKNLSATYGGGSKRLLMPDGVPYIDSPNISLYGIIEASKNFDDIYPRLSSTGAGTVTSVGDKFTFTDTAMDFDINEHLLNQVPPKVRFLTGQCAGYDFEVGSYNKLTNTFVILENRTESDLPLPSDLLKPAPTDKYTLLDIAMPTDYILAAEAELDAKAVEHLYEFHNPRVQYRVKFSELFAKLELPVMQCGDQVRIIDTDLGIDTLIRINKLQRGIRNKYDIQIELDKTVTKTKLETITEELNNFNNEVIVNNITSRSRWIEAYQRAKEIKELVFDPDGYFDTGNIRPGSIETGMIAVGSRSQQFQTTCVLQPNWGGNPQYFYWSAGVLTHFTIKNDGTAQDWTIGAGNYIIGGDDQTKPLYIYARCSRTGSTGDIYLNAAPFRFDADETHWLFLVGILHSPIANVRGISLSNGQTLISGQWITTGVISSIDGSTQFDLNNGVIKGNILFLSGGALKNIDQVIGGIKVGARNLLLNSGATITGLTDPAGKVVMADYPRLSSMLEIGKEYSFSYRRISGLHLTQVVLCTNDLAQVVSIPLVNDSAVFECTVPNITRLLYYGPPSSEFVLEKFKLENGNKVTDWSPAPEDIDAMISQVADDVAEALSEVQNANSYITDLSTYVDGSFKDGVISKSEAQAIEKYINQINSSRERVFSEYEDLYKNTYLTGTAKTNLLNAKITLFGYIDALISAIQAAIADGATTPVEKANVDAKYADYIAALGGYTSAVTLAGKAIHDRLNELSLMAISELEIGGENLYNGNNTLSISSLGGTTPTITRNTIDTPNGFEIVSSSGGYLTEARISNVVRSNGHHVVSCFIRVAFGTANVAIDICDNLAQNISVNTDWKLVQAVANVSNYSPGVYNFVDFHTNNHVTIQVKDFMVQKGNKATDFKKSTEFLLQALQGSTDVLGGLLATNVILMKNQENNITGGVSGLIGDNIAQWSGGTYNQAIEDAEREFGANMQTGSLDKKDGSGHRAFGKIAWDALGNTYYAGIIEALAGKIGGLNIFENTLHSETMSFSETPVETLSSLMSPTSASISQQSSWSKTIQNQTASAFTQPILLTTDSQLRFRATCVPGHDLLHPNSRRWEVRIFGANNVIVFRDYGEGILNEQLYSVNLPAGEFVVNAIAYQAGVISSNVTNTATLTGESTNVIYAYSYTAQTKIGSDGFYSFWSSDRYIYFKSNYGFEGRYGSIGLRFITGQSNPQKMIGGAWSNL